MQIKTIRAVAVVTTDVAAESRSLSEVAAKIKGGLSGISGQTSSNCYMNIQTTNKLVQAQGELRQRVIELIQENDLPVSDLDDDKWLFALLQDGEVVGSGGLEVFSDCALVRSVSVRKNLQGGGLGKIIINELERISTEQGIHCLYLLTTTAKAFFSKQGYKVVHREDAPTAIKNTSEFSFICSSSSTLMKKQF